jgi:hypothetical protein
MIFKSYISDELFSHIFTNAAIYTRKLAKTNSVGVDPSNFKNQFPADTRGMRGVTGAYSGICKCGHTTLAMQGDPNSVALAMSAYEDFIGERGCLILATKKSNDVTTSAWDSRT